MNSILQYHGNTYAHISRIVNDGGLVLNAEALNKTVNNNLLNPSFSISPMLAYKTGKIYSNVLNGNLDFTFSRNSQKAVPLDYKGDANTIISNDTPSIDYSSGTPTLLLEPPRTNLFLNSDVLTNQTVYLTSGRYTVSFYGGGTVTLYNSNGTLLASIVSNTSNRYSRTITGVTTGNKTISVSGTVTKASLEKGDFATSYIRSTSTQGVRTTENLSLTNLYTNGFITSAGGTWFIDIFNNYNVLADSANINLQLVDSVSNGIAFSNSSEIEVRKLRVINSAELNYETTADRVKIIVKWNGTIIDVFENGVKVVSASPFTITEMETLMTAGISSSMYIANMWLAPTPLTDSECISLTQL
jgi:hypothetical protein